MNLILRWIVNSLALLALPYILPSISVAGFYTALIAALVLGLLNTLVRPVLIVLTLPINILTLGLFTFVINALLFWFVGSFVKGFHVAGFWAAFFGALIYSVITALVNALLFRPREP